MTCLFPYYNEIRNKVLICYLGHSKDYLVQLRIIRPYLEKLGLDIWIGCRDEYRDWVDKVITLSDFEDKKEEFVYSLEITYASDEIHPIWKLWKEAEVKLDKIEQKPPQTTIAILTTECNYPTKPLSIKQTTQLREYLLRKGMSSIVETNDKSILDKAGIVAGVENALLFEAASRGIYTILIPTGLGTELYKTLFSKAEVLIL